MSELRENRFIVFPVLLSWYSVLALAAANYRTTGGIEDLPLTLMFAAVIGALAWLASGIVSRDADRRTLIALGVMAWFAGYSLLVRPLSRIGAPDLAAFLLACAVLAALVTVVTRLPQKAAATWALLARRTVLVLLLFPLLSFVATLAQASRAPERTAELHGAAPPPDAPNVFLIMLDKYTAGRALLDNYGFDNSAFEQRLRERGFVVPQHSRSNYPHTWMTLASMLNWGFLNEVLGWDESERRPIQNAIDDNRTWRFLRERGYEFVFLPTTYYHTRRNDHADRQIPAPRAAGVYLATVWLGSTPLSLLTEVVERVPTRLTGGGRSRFPYPIESAEEIREKIDIIADLAAEPGHRFVFAHLLVPHEPYIFTSDCQTREPYWPATDYVADQRPIRDAYLAQVACVNVLVEELVDRILAVSTTEPIILLQSDHGHGMMAVNPLRGEQLPLDELDPAQVDERTAIFAAYLLPGTGRVAVYDSISPVNVMPAVLNQFFDADIPMREDKVFWARLHPPHDFVRIR